MLLDGAEVPTIPVQILELPRRHSAFGGISFYQFTSAIQKLISKICKSIWTD